MKKCKVNTSTIVKVFKAVLSLLNKTDTILLTFEEQKLVVSSDSFTFVIKSDYVGDTITGQFLVSEFTTLSKLIKKEQVKQVELSLNEETKTLIQKIPNGLQLKSFFEIVEPIETINIANDILYLESSQLGNISRVIKDQKDLNYINLLDIGFLFVGERQVSYLPFGFEENFDVDTAFEKTTDFTNTQINNLVSIAGELGLSESNSLVWGKADEAQLSLLADIVPEVNFQVSWPNLEALSLFKYQNWKELCQRFEREVNNRALLEIVNTKELKKLITSSKSGINDVQDLCVLETNIEDQTLDLYFYQDKDLRNSFSFTADGILFPYSDISINVQTKHLLSMLSLCDNSLSLLYLNESEPIWSTSDTSIQTITMQSLLV